MRILLNNEKGLTLIEVLIAGFLSALVAGAALHFYLAEHKVWLTQSDVSDMQQSARACLDEICETTRMAGYGLAPSHPAYRIGNHSLILYSHNGTDVDTVLFYIDGSTETYPCLVRQQGSLEPEVFAENVEALTVNRLNAALLEIGIVSRSNRTEEGITEEDGYLRRELTSRVRIRNIGS